MNIETFRNKLCDAFINAFVEAMPTEIGDFTNAGGDWDGENLMISYLHKDKSLPMFELAFMMKFPNGSDDIRITLYEIDSGDCLGMKDIENLDELQNIGSVVNTWMAEYQTN